MEVAVACCCRITINLMLAPRASFQLEAPSIRKTVSSKLKAWAMLAAAVRASIATVLQEMHAI
jgi:hypothetical protein